MDFRHENSEAQTLLEDGRRLGGGRHGQVSDDAGWDSCLWAGLFWAFPGAVGGYDSMAQEEKTASARYSLQHHLVELSL
jgi:hypothetical protein